MERVEITGAVPLTDQSSRSYVEWGAVFAGAAVAVALSFTLFAFAAGVGLAVASPWPGSGAEPETLSWLSVVWLIFVMIFSSLAGGYIAGRLRMPRVGATADEIEFRDGAHGLLVWGTGLILAAIAAMALSLAAGAAAGAAAVALDDDPVDYTTSLLLRDMDENRDAIRAEIAPLYARLAAGEDVSDADRAYVAALLMEQGVAEADARSRTDAWVAAQRETIDDARRAGSIAAFLIAASLLTAAAAAYFAGGVGGRHRDRNAPFPWTRTRVVSRPVEASAAKLR